MALAKLLTALRPWTGGDDLLNHNELLTQQAADHRFSHRTAPDKGDLVVVKHLALH
jgi:hypothetical protein